MGILPDAPVDVLGCIGDVGEAGFGSSEKKGKGEESKTGVGTSTKKGKGEEGEIRSSNE